MSIFRMQIPCSFGNCTNVDLEQCDECKLPVCSSHRRQRDPRYGGGFLCQRCMAERQSSTSSFPPEVEALLGQAAQVNPSLAQWEYCRVKQQGSTAVIFLLQGSKPHKLLVSLGLPYGTDPDGLKDYMVTRLGADGWEMVSHHYVAVEQAEQWYFKRRRQHAHFRAAGPE
ncbi:MAG TPA: hypothetical protein VF099_05675 [Ktedonobacterales bacterium]